VEKNSLASDFITNAIFGLLDDLLSAPFEAGLLVAAESRFELQPPIIVASKKAQKHRRNNPLTGNSLRIWENANGRKDCMVCVRWILRVEVGKNTEIKYFEYDL
jgi:hypothetical protein